MKTTLKLACWTPPTVAFLALIFLANISRAASPIVYNFASDLQGWSGNEPAGMAATYSWNATGGSTGGGCMQVVFDGTTTTEMDPWVTLPSPLNEAQYVSVIVHMMVDPGSGTTGNLGSGGYGNLQAVFRDAGGSWDGMWHGTIYPPAANAWVTYSFVVAQPYKPAEKNLQIQLQGIAGYTGSVTCYVDNVTITPVPNPWLLDVFTNDTSSAYAEEGWTGISESSSLNTSVDAGGGFSPLGALQMDIAFPVAGQWEAWGQSWVMHQQAMDPSRFTSLEFDVKVDAANSTPFSDGSYGALTISVRDGNWNGPYACTPGGFPLTASFTSWTHEKLALPTGVSALTNSVGFDIIVAGNYMGPVRLYFDNFKLSKPVNLPQITGILPGTPGGIKITVDTDGTNNQYDQEAICTANGDNTTKDFFWLNQVPATYGFSMTNFPSPAVAPGFDAHIYVLNGDTISSGTTGSFNYNETYSGVNWNAYDLIGLQVQNGTNGGVVCNFIWKTNAPSFNASNWVSCTLSNLTSANGTWALNFSDNTHGSITLNGAEVTNFTMPDFLSDPNYAANFTPGTSFVQFGLAKHDVENTGVNNGQSAIFTHVTVTNSALGSTYDESFSGPGLTANHNWQTCTYYIDGAPRVTWQPFGTALWVKWNTSENGWTLQSSSNLLSGWGSVTAAYTYVDTTGTNTLGAIPQTNMPAADAGFFRIANPNP